MSIAIDRRPLADLVVGDLVFEVDGIELLAPRSVCAALGPITPGGPLGVMLDPSPSGVEFVLYDDRDEYAVVIPDVLADKPVSQPRPAPQTVTLPEEITTAAPHPDSRFRPRGLTDVQFYVLVRALTEGGFVRAHGSCLNALEERGLAAWIPDAYGKPSNQVRGRLTPNGVITARGDTAQTRARVHVARGY